MIILQGHATTPDELEVVTGQAADIDVQVNGVDSSQSAPIAPENPSPEHDLITTATTTVIATAPSNASKVKGIETLSIRNRDTTDSCQVTVQIDRNSVGSEVVQLRSFNLAPGEEWHYENGVGWYPVAASPVTSSGGRTNYAFANTSAGFASDTYITGSALKLMALGTPVVGRIFHWRFMISKTAAGTATPIFTVRFGTAGTTSDTGRVTFTFGAGTAAADRGEVEMEVAIAATGATGNVDGKANWTTNLTTTGLTNAVKALSASSSNFDLTVAGTIVGVSYNGGTSAAHTIEWVTAWSEDLVL